MRLQGPHLSVLALGHIEDDDVRVELRRGVAVHRTGGVMLELGRDKLPGRLGGMIAADAGLRVPLQLIQGDIDGLAVRLAHAVIAADKRGQRDGLGRGKRSIPTGAMLDRRDHLSRLRSVLMDGAMEDQLLAGLRVLAFGETGELLRANGTGQARIFRPACRATHPEWCRPASNSSARRR